MTKDVFVSISGMHEEIAETSARVFARSCYKLSTG